MLSHSIRSRLCQVIPVIRLSTVNAGDFVNRTILKVLDSDGKPFHPEPDIPSSPGEKFKIVEPLDKRRFNPGAYSSYMRELSMKNIQKCHFDNRFTYITINYQHPDFTRAKLIIRGLTPEKKKFIGLEGKNIIRDAFQCGLKLDKLFFTRESVLQAIPELESLLVAVANGQYKDHGAVLLKVTPKMMDQLSEVQTPPGLIGLFYKPDSNSETSATRTCGIPVTVIGDNIRDPGNMGTLIRSSAAIGAERMVCMKGCANPWESKVVRSGAGAHFRVNLSTDMQWSDLPSVLPPADSILLFAEKSKTQSDEFTSAKTIVNRNYFDVDYSNFIHSNKKLALIVGGETDGISDEAHSLTSLYRESFKVNIPILKGIDSLNSAIAGSIILFEIQRQIIKKF